MSNVIDINANKPHWTGPVTCSACGREWQAVAPEGTDLCECPSCGCMAGVRFSPRELMLIRALEKVKTGYALGENSRINWDIAKGVAGEALASVGWPVTGATMSQKAAFALAHPVFDPERQILPQHTTTMPS